MYRPSGCTCGSEETVDRDVVQFSLAITNYALGLGRAGGMCDPQITVALALAMSRVTMLGPEIRGVGEAKESINEAARMARGFCDQIHDAMTRARDSTSRLLGPVNDNRVGEIKE